MFSLILKVVGSLLHFYVAWRAAGVPCVRRRVGPGAWAVAALLVWLVYLVGIGMRRESTGFGWLLAQFSLNWLGAMLLIAVCFVAVDVATGFGLWLRRWAPQARTMAVVAGVVLTAYAFFQGLRAPVITAYEARLSGLPPALDGTIVAVLTDLHLGNQRDIEWMQARVEQVQALAPDLVVMVGDQVDSELPDPLALPTVLRRLQAPLGVWAVTGNHDYHGDLGETIARFEAGGVRWLRNEVRTLRPGLSLAGVDDLGRLMRRADGSADAAVAQVLAQRPEQGATILLSHTPTAVEQAAESGAALTLSGHTHGGQIWPFGYLVQRVFPHMIGVHNIGEMTLIVSRGTGSWGPRMRLWHPGEILKVTLRTDDGDSPEE